MKCKQCVGELIKIELKPQSFSEPLMVVQMYVQNRVKRKENKFNYLYACSVCGVVSIDLKELEEIK